MSLRNKKIIANTVEIPEDNESVMEKLARLPKEQREEILKEIVANKYPDIGYEAIKYDWDLWARPTQLTYRTLDWDQWKNLAVIAGRGYGKDVDIHTEVFTESGWKTMETIQVGDRVIDENGNWCNVTNVFNIEIPKKAYRLVFNDDTEVLAGEDHFWYTWTHQNRKQYNRHYITEHGKSASDFPDNWANYCPKPDLLKQVATLALEGYSKKAIIKKTKANPSEVSTILNKNYIFGTKKVTTDIFKTSNYGKREDSNHCIPNVRPLKLQKNGLPLHPWVLGYWLANGTSGSNKIIGHQDDLPEIIKAFKSVGYDCLHKAGSQEAVVKDITPILKELNVFNNKHIPDIYLYSSVEDRLQLLQGLMSGDGGVDKASSVSYTSSRKLLLEQVHWIVVSLGMRCKIDSRIPSYTYKGRKFLGQRSYRLSFVPTFDVFLLPRKSNRISMDCSQLLKRKHRMIKVCEEIAPIPMRCIAVDSPNGIYCITRSMIPTSNTRMGAEYVRWLAENKLVDRIAIVGATNADVNNVMLGGVSGILGVCPPWNMPHHSPTSKRLTWRNGVIAEFFSAEQPERLRGPQFGAAWLDEICAWTYQRQAYDMLSFGLRNVDNPKIMITTTPKPQKLLLDILGDKLTYTITGKTEDNRSNLGKEYIRDVVDRYKGTRLGRQELDAEILMDVPGALWSLTNLDEHRIPQDQFKSLPDFSYVVLAIDPAMTALKNSAETGMCVAAYGVDGNFYILHLDSVKLSPSEWSKLALQIYDEFICDKIIVETNQGGDLVTATIKQVRPHINIAGVYASRGKMLRAEPIAALYERGKVHHVGYFQKGEDQMINFNPVENPEGLKDCVDALVYAMTALVDKSNAVINGLPLVGGVRSKLVSYRYR